MTLTADTSSCAGELDRLAASWRARGAQVVAVQGLGFVGAAVAAAVSSARSADGSPAFFVLGVDLPSASGRARIEAINAGRAPIASPDSSFDELLGEAKRIGNLLATADERAYALADVIVVDVHLDVKDITAPHSAAIDVDIASLRAAIATIGKHMREDALVLIETTVPPGTTVSVVAATLREARAERGIASEPLIAHAYERVMPGPNYIRSIRGYWRSYSGNSAESRMRARGFLSRFINVDEYPLRELDDPNATELAKTLENSYRAANIAFMHEWTRAAESIGVNLFDVVDSIRVRKGTHDNMRYPGFGVGGYCLTKDSLLAQWGLKHLLGSNVELEMTLRALEINRTMPEHTLRLLEEILARPLRGAKVTLLGASYVAGVGDTRNSPSRYFVELLQRADADVRVHDPCVDEWPECPDVPLFADLGLAMHGADAIVLAVGHQEYFSLEPPDLLRLCGGPVAIVDAWNVLNDAKAASLRDAGFRLIGVGKGHWRKRGYHL